MELGVCLWLEVLPVWMEELGVVLEVMQWLQRVLQGQVLELLLLLMMVVVRVMRLQLLLLLQVVMVVLMDSLLVCIKDNPLWLVLEELLKLLGGFFVSHKPILLDGHSRDKKRKNRRSKKSLTNGGKFNELMMKSYKKKTYL